MNIFLDPQRAAEIAIDGFPLPEFKEGQFWAVDTLNGNFDTFIVTQISEQHNTPGFKNKRKAFMSPLNSSEGITVVRNEDLIFLPTVQDFLEILPDCLLQTTGNNYKIYLTKEGYNTEEESDVFSVLIEAFYLTKT